jgi:sialic acid synthase SpsE
MQIGPAVIGAGEPAFVIAEIGVNHDGDLGVARELIHAAVDAEADAVKFQVFAPDRLVRRDAPTAAYQRKARESDSQYEMLARLALSYDQFLDLAGYAGQCGVEFLATPFSVPDLQFLVSMGVRAIKIASTDIVNAPLLDAAAASGLPLIVSRGAADCDEIAAALERFRNGGGESLALLHCVSSYPTPEYAVNLGALHALRQQFGCLVGFSDHTESLLIGGYAATAGACIIEKHITLNRSRQGPDHAFSLEPDQFAEYVRGIRKAEVLMGNGRITVSPFEFEVRQLSRGSLVAARDIQPGDILTAEMLTVKRPGDGISPMAINRLVGRQASRPIPANAPLTWEVLA